MHTARKAARHFVLKYNLHGGNLTAEKTQKVLELLELAEYAKDKDGFVYVSSTDKAVFTSNHMGEDEELYILLHEEGHISCNHPVQHGVLAYSDVLCEQEANSFAFYVMQYAKFLRGWRTFLRYAAAVCISAVIALIL